MEINVKDYMAMQPASPTVAVTDRFYLALAQHLTQLWEQTPEAPQVSPATLTDVVLTVVGYYQDIVADAGLWRCFTQWHAQHHGTPLPHYARSEDYIDSELNLDDVRYLIWYTLDGDDTLPTKLSPHDARITAVATAWHDVLDTLYEKAPTAADYTLIVGVDPDDPADAQHTYDMMHWLYWRSYLMRRSSREAALRHIDEAHALIATHGEQGAVPHLHDLNDRIMATTPIGPVPLPIAEWVRMLTR